MTIGRQTWAGPGELVRCTQRRVCGADLVPRRPAIACWNISFPLADLSGDVARIDSQSR